jgi:glucose 1-dehydrogenase
MGVLDGEVALVTGAGRGIGRGIAIALAQAGADVAINYLDDRAEAEETAREVERAGRRFLLAPGDVSDYHVVEKLAAETAQTFGRLTIGVANAVYSDRELFYEADLEGFRRTIDVTMWGAFHLLRAAARQMLAQGGGGAIVLVSSPQAYIPVPHSMAYNMAKAAVDQMARTAAIELIEHRVRVNIMTPGWIDTPGERKFTPEDAIERVGKKLPWGRLGRPDEIGRGVVFLCDPQSEYVTGAKLLMDGGVTLPWWASRGTGVPQ